jgi:hypothetical protein
MNYRHPWQMKKSESWEPFLSYQLNSTANPAHLPQNWAKLAKSEVLFSSKRAPRILIFSIAMDADDSFYVKVYYLSLRHGVTAEIFFSNSIMNRIRLNLDYELLDSEIVFSKVNSVQEACTLSPTSSG